MKTKKPLKRKAFKRKPRKRATQEELDHLAAVKKSGCRCCWGCDASTGLPLESHHLLDGGQRRGHFDTICLCSWHHRAECIDGLSKKDMLKIFGPALSEGTKPFHERWGSDEDLLAFQKELLARLK